MPVQGMVPAPFTHLGLQLIVREIVRYEYGVAQPGGNQYVNQKRIRPAYQVVHKGGDGY